jgi:hypothetical protein
MDNEDELLDTDVMKEELRQALESVPLPIDLEGSELNHAAYTVSELRISPDHIDSVSPEQVALCYRVVKYLELNGGKWPDKFRM